MKNCSSQKLLVWYFSKVGANVVKPHMLKICVNVRKSFLRMLYFQTIHNTTQYNSPYLLKTKCVLQ